MRRSTREFDTVTLGCYAKLLRDIRLHAQPRAAEVLAEGEEPPHQLVARRPGLAALEEVGDGLLVLLRHPILLPQRPPDRLAPLAVGEEPADLDEASAHGGGLLEDEPVLELRQVVRQADRAAVEVAVGRNRSPPFRAATSRSLETRSLPPPPIKNSATPNSPIEKTEGTSRHVLSHTRSLPLYPMDSHTPPVDFRAGLKEVAAHAARLAAGIEPGSHAGLQPAVDDEREVHVTSEELRRVLMHLEGQFRDFVSLAILLAVDRGPLTRIRPRYFNAAAGTLEVLDNKTSHRRRRLLLSEPAIRILSRLTARLAPDELVFTFTEGQIRHAWETARDLAAGQASRNRRERGAKKALPEVNPSGIVTLPELRFKDLRHVLPTAWEALKLPRGELQMVMGHAKGSKMTDRYITTVGDRNNMDAVAAFLGIDQPLLKAG